jgi:pilus assembly protein CpaF
MSSWLNEFLLGITAKRRRPPDPEPLLVELFKKPDTPSEGSTRSYPFSYRVSERDSAPFYEVFCQIPPDVLVAIRKTVGEISHELDPKEVEPLTFDRLIQVLSQHSARRLAEQGVRTGVRELAELAAYEAIGLPRILALAKDERISEFFVDSDATPIYLDHVVAGRCESEIFLTERERWALETHVDTFSGYTLDFKTPSMKNDLAIGGAILRVSLDLEPVSVNRFALDVRRINVSSLSMEQLIALGVISVGAAALLVTWIETGGNVTIVGETGTGKTTLLNALDEQAERRLRRLYIEDAVETRDMLDRGYHQMKVKVDPFERGVDASRTKESEIVKALHRSPDIVILSEIQSEEHSRAFFQALAAGARGIQTFHATTIEQAIRRWVSMHHIAEQSLLDLGILVQMARPEKLGQGRYVQRVCAVVQDRGTAKVKELFMRDREFRLLNVTAPDWPLLSGGTDFERFQGKVEAASRRFAEGQIRK